MGRTSSGDQIEILKFYVCLIGIGNIICYPFFIEPSQIPKKVTAFPLSKDTTGLRGGGGGGGGQTLKPQKKIVSRHENGTPQKYQKGNLSLFKETPRQSNVTLSPYMKTLTSQNKSQLPKDEGF